MVKSESGGLELIEAHAPMGIRSRSSSACTCLRARGGVRYARQAHYLRHWHRYRDRPWPPRLRMPLSVHPARQSAIPPLEFSSRALIRPCAASYSAGVPMMKGAMVQCSSRRMRGVPMHGRGRSQASLGGQHFKPTDGSGHLTEQRFGMVRYRNSERPILWCRSYNFVV